MMQDFFFFFLGLFFCQLLASTSRDAFQDQVARSLSCQSQMILRTPGSTTYLPIYALFLSILGTLGAGRGKVIVKTRPC